MANLQLDIIVVGGGIAGLTAALALRRQGHTVTVVESSAWLREFGAAVTVPPNANRVLTDLGIDIKRDARAAPFRTSKVYHCTNRDKPPKFGPNGDGHDLPWVDTLKALNLTGQFYLAHRVDLHDALRNKCVSLDGPGKPVDIILSSKVVSWDPEGTVRLSDGKEMSGDLIVAADGIRSEAHETILGHKVPAVSGGLDSMRFVVKTEDILNDPATKQVMDDGPGCFAFYFNQDRNRHLLRFTCRNDEMQNFGAFAYDGPTDSLTGQQVSKAELFERLSTLPPLFQALGNKAASVYLWKIGDRKPIPSYCRDRLVVIGDAAHPMWPRQGQGAAQSIEDAGTLGVLMSQLEDKSDIPGRLELYDKLRVGRTSIVQLLSRASEAHNKELKSISIPGATLPEEILLLFKQFAAEYVPLNYEQLMGWLWLHDCLGQAKAVLPRYNSSSISLEVSETSRQTQSNL